MKLEIQYWPVGNLRPDPKNARTHSAQQLADIAKAIAEDGFINPCLVSADGTIRAGEGRWRAAQKAGLDAVPVIVLPTMSEAAYTRLSLRDNKLALNSGWDEGLLREALVSIKAEGAAVTDLGFDDHELAKALQIETPLKVKTVPTSTINDRFWISVRGPLQSQAKALAAIRAYMADLPGVEVELGTIGIEE